MLEHSHFQNRTNTRMCMCTYISICSNVFFAILALWCTYQYQCCYNFCLTQLNSFATVFNACHWHVTGEEHRIKVIEIFGVINIESLWMMHEFNEYNKQRNRSLSLIYFSLNALNTVEICEWERMGVCIWFLHECYYISLHTLFACDFTIYRSMHTDLHRPIATTTTTATI